MAPNDRSWSVSPSNKCRITANGTNYDVDPGLDFVKEVNRVAILAGFRSNIYVAVSQNGGPSAFINDPNTAPTSTEAGMVVKLSPHIEGA